MRRPSVGGTAVGTGEGTGRISTTPVVTSGAGAGPGTPVVAVGSVVTGAGSVVVVTTRRSPSSSESEYWSSTCPGTVPDPV